MGVDVWLRGLGLGQYEERFRDNKINADLLRRLTGDDLKVIGVTALGDRLRLLDAIAGLAGAKPPADVPAVPSRSVPPMGPQVSAERASVEYDAAFSHRQPMRRSSGWVSAIIVSTIIAAGSLFPQFARSQGSAGQPATSASANASPLRFQHLRVATGGDIPEVCFQFSETLDARAEAHYGDYIAVTPEITPSVRASGNDLCLGGLAFGTNYQVTLRKGLPARSGVRTQDDETVDVSLGDRTTLVAVSGDGFILPRAKGTGLTIQTVNVDKVKIHVLRMSDRLLPSQMRRSQYDFLPAALRRVDDPISDPRIAEGRGKRDLDRRHDSRVRPQSHSPNGLSFGGRHQAGSARRLPGDRRG